MKIVISNTKYDYNIGCRLLKSKYGNTPFKGLEDIWDEILPITFAEICVSIKNIEERRVAIGCLGMENIIKELNPTLINSETLNKKTSWINEEGRKIEMINYDDTYELYKVNGIDWGVNLDDKYGLSDLYYVKFKDTSTSREYMIWVDGNSVFSTNKEGYCYTELGKLKYTTAINSIAWSFMTILKKGDIEKIVRQGDCILFKKKKGAVELNQPRHLTGEEYRTLLESES